MITSMNAEADYKFKTEMRKYTEVNNNHECGYFEYKNGLYQNYFAHVLNYVKEHAGHQFSYIPNSLKQHLTMIDRCFYPSTLEEIVENLKQENTDFAKQVLKMMDQNSTLSMKIALKMLRKAKN